MKKCFFQLAVVCFFLMSSVSSEEKGYVPRDGFVPDARTAIRIAEAVLGPIYGEAKIQAERPFKATLSKGTWIVEGSLPEGWDGGVATVKISKRDGRILFVIHGK